LEVLAHSQSLKVLDVLSEAQDQHRVR